MKKIGIGMILSVAAIFMTSCSLDKGENKSFSVYPSALTPKAIAGSSTFKVYYTHAVSLKVDKGGDWCTVSPTSIVAPINGYDSTSVTVTYTANMTDQARETSIVLNLGDMENFVIVRQASNVAQ